MFNEDSRSLRGSETEFTLGFKLNHPQPQAGTDPQAALRGTAPQTWKVALAVGVTDGIIPRFSVQW